MNRFDPGQPMQVGGQAVLEGVMMRAPGAVATAVRKKDGTITVRREEHRTLAERYPILKAPVLRGTVGLVEMLVVGIRTLNFSAEVAMTEDQGTEAPSGSGNDLRLWLSLALALAVGVAVFFMAPLAAATALFNVDQDPVLFNLATGMIRLGLFLLYLGGIVLMKDIQRVFAYHGAEHKVVFAFERGLELTVEAALGQSRFHPRCGTSFLLVVMMSAILVFAVVDGIVISLTGGISLPVRLLTHLPLIPVVGGISYEFIRFSARHTDTLIGRWVVAPGLWLQRITTREPDRGQVEVALAALQAALAPAEARREEPVVQGAA
jgi:uncharacterized protein YqhQ